MIVFMNFLTMLYYDPTYLTEKGGVTTPRWVYFTSVVLSFVSVIPPIVDIDTVSASSCTRASMLSMESRLEGPIWLDRLAKCLITVSSSSSSDFPYVPNAIQVATRLIRLWKPLLPVKPLISVARGGLSRPRSLPLPISTSPHGRSTTPANSFSVSSLVLLKAS